MDASWQSSVAEQSDSEDEVEVGELSCMLQETATSVMRTILFFKDRGVIPHEYLCFLQRLSRQLTAPTPGELESDLYERNPQLEQQRKIAESSNIFTPLKSSPRGIHAIVPRRLFAADSPSSVSPGGWDMNSSGSPTDRSQSTFGNTDMSKGSSPYSLSSVSPARMNVTPEYMDSSWSTMSPTRMTESPVTSQLSSSIEHPAWRNAVRPNASLNRSSPTQMDVSPDAIAHFRSKFTPECMTGTPRRGSLSRSTLSPSWKNTTRTISPPGRSVTSPARTNLTTSIRPSYGPQQMNRTYEMASHHAPGDITRTIHSHPFHPTPHEKGGHHHHSVDLPDISEFEDFQPDLESTRFGAEDTCVK